MIQTYAHQKELHESRLNLKTLEGMFVNLIGLSSMILIMGIGEGGFISTLWGIVRDITPSNILGLTSGVLNPAPVLGVGAIRLRRINPRYI